MTVRPHAMVACQLADIEIRRRKVSASRRPGSSSTRVDAIFWSYIVIIMLLYSTEYSYVDQSRPLGRRAGDPESSHLLTGGHERLCAQDGHCTPMRLFS